MNPLGIPEEMMQKIVEQAEREYPYECCGMILGPKNQPGIFSRLHPCRNVQDEYHAKDPENFPRTAKTAYFIDSKDLLAIQREGRLKDEEIRILYHSHIDTGAYFSEEDTRVAAPEGDPAYPGVNYLVVSVVQKKVKDACLFGWDLKKKEFVQIA